MIFHTLRHTFASWYMINGGDVYRLKGYMGHCDLKLTERYAHLSPAHRKAGVAYFGAPETRIHTVDTNAESAEREAPATA